MTYSQRSLVMLPRSACLAMLANEKVGRVVYTEDALPAVQPVTYALQGDAVVFCTSADTHLAKAARHSVLAFEIDGLDSGTRTGWSVIVTGQPTLVTEPVERARIHALVEPWAPGHHDVFIRLPLTMLSGRQVVANAVA